MLSMVATRRSADSRSGARVPKARQAPLNSSILAMRLRISGVIWRVSVCSMNQYYTHLHPISSRAHYDTHLHPIRRRQCHLACRRNGAAMDSCQLIRKETNMKVIPARIGEDPMDH